MSVIITPEEDRRRQNQLLEDADKVKKAGLFNTTVGGLPIITGSDSDLDEKKYRRNLMTAGEAARKNFDEKIFMFPESYNQLRKEIHDNWPNLWATVSWRMANRAEEFIEQMNAALDLAVVFDTDKVDFISKTYLAALRKKRGVSA